jgi:hypothetical protein
MISRRACRDLRERQGVFPNINRSGSVASVRGIHFTMRV